MLDSPATPSHSQKRGQKTNVAQIVQDRLNDNYRTSSALNRRRNARYFIDEEVTLSVLSPIVMHDIPAQTVDIARNGIGVISAQPITQPSVVEIRCGRNLLFGEVRHCRAIEQGYRIGIAITDAYVIESGAESPLELVLGKEPAS
jgi:hypothetical protein